ncbi:MAG: 6-phosphogluconolactonase [Pyrinomonadaceae bacterium]
MKSRAAKSSKVFDTLDELSRSVACEIVDIARRAIQERDLFHLVLSGGNTPKRLYELLATEEFRRQIDWMKTHLYWADERFVAHTDTESNFKLVDDLLIKHIESLPAGNVHPIPTIDYDPETAAMKYESELRQNFRADWPSFDLILLGIGTDGHTASLFPGTSGISNLNETVKWVAPSMAPIEPRQRITLTYPAINHARKIIFLVDGADKREVLDAIFSSIDEESEIYPAARIFAEDGSTRWFVSRSALAK